MSLVDAVNGCAGRLRIERQRGNFGANVHKQEAVVRLVGNVSRAQTKAVYQCEMKFMGAVKADLRYLGGDSLSLSILAAKVATELRRRGLYCTPWILFGTFIPFQFYFVSGPRLCAIVTPRYVTPHVVTPHVVTPRVVTSRVRAS